MKTFGIWQLVACSLVVANVARGVEHRVEALKEAPPTADLSPQIASELALEGVRVIRAPSTTLCDIWLCKHLAVKPDFKQTIDVLYPFQPGQLIGVARFARKSADFRNQDIEAGTYTLRYSQQPIDGAHVGTSPTRDFLLLIQAKKDQSPGLLDYKVLTKQSAEAAGSTHPALLPLQKAATDSKEFPVIRHNAERDWWTVAMQRSTKPESGAKPLVIELLVVGIAAE